MCSRQRIYFILMMNEPTSSTLPRPGLRTPANEQRSPFRATLVAWLVWTISLLTATAALVLRVPLYAWASFTQDASSFATALYWLVLVPAAVPMYATVGAVIAARRPGHWVGWLCLLLAWSIALEDLCWQYAGRAAATTASVPTSGVVAALASSVVAGMTPLFLILLLLRLPTGTFLSPRWRMVSWGR